MAESDEERRVEEALEQACATGGFGQPLVQRTLILKRLAQFVLVVLFLYYVVWHVFVFCTRVALWLYQILSWGWEYVPPGFQAILDLDARWTFVPPSWLLWVIGVPVLCCVAVAILRYVRLPLVTGRSRRGQTKR